NYSITYHDPCHARKMQGVFKEPRELLKTNYHFVEMSNSNTCCGFGGVGMQTDYYDRALSVGLKKAQMIDESKASVVSAECSACRMQISNALEQNSSKVVFASPLELIAKAL
ncbi:(Fe-S)-binding protein, partial [Campylobacter jejuni]|nr:(Fe-S)-binding protein [Campylobacter jejuni]MPO54868.1 glycerol-3-phosphate dehydrogenase [Campylobacter jejuni]